MWLLILLQIQFNFQEGDLLFQDCQCGPICEAIEDVNEEGDQRRFSHMAIVISDSGSLKVIEANTAGVRKVHLDSFLSRYIDDKGNPRIAVGRLKKNDPSLISKAAQFVQTKLGMSYDYEFIANNDKFYCSELIYEAFKHANKNKDFFHEKKMTFKKYKTKSYHPVFVSYYKEIKKKIPEGKRGTNPSQISRDHRLTITYLFAPKSSQSM